MKALQHILTEIKDQILYVTINREQKLNALNKEILAELALVFEMASANEAVRGVILTGAGTKAFVAGADIAEFSNYTAEEGEELARTGQRNVFDAIEDCPKPVIAAINGFALGGGLELAMACHMRVAAAHAKMGLPEVSLGLIPGYGGTQRLTRLVGKGRAIELIATAEMINAVQAERIGLVNYIAGEGELIAKAEEILNKIKLRAPLAVAAAIKAVNSAFEGPTGFEVEIREFGRCFGTKDFKEGVSAFLEKRAPEFRGE